MTALNSRTSGRARRQSKVHSRNRRCSVSSYAIWNENCHLPWLKFCVTFLSRIAFKGGEAFLAWVWRHQYHWNLETCWWDLWCKFFWCWTIFLSWATSLDKAKARIGCRVVGRLVNVVIPELIFRSYSSSRTKYLQPMHCLPTLKSVLQKCDKNSRQSSRSNCHERWSHFAASASVDCTKRDLGVFVMQSEEANWQTTSAKP